jgi:hypothetical protein
MLVQCPLRSCQSPIKKLTDKFFFPTRTHNPFYVSTALTSAYNSAQIFVSRTSSEMSDRTSDQYALWYRTTERRKRVS